MLTKMHGLAGWLIVAGFALVTTNPLLAQERGERGGPAGQHVSGQLKSIDAAAHTITITTTTPGGGGRDGGERREPVTTEKTFSLAKNVEVAVGTGTFFSSPWGRVGAHVPLFKEAKLTELAAGIQVSLALSADQKTAVSILAAGPVVKGVLKAVDATKNTITIQLPGRAGGRGGEAAVAGEEKTYTVAPHAEIAMDDGRGTTYSVKEAKLADLSQGALVTVHVYVDMKHVQNVLAEGPSHHGTIKAINAGKRTLTLMVREPHGDDAGEEYNNLSVAKDAVVVVDNGKGKLLSARLAKLDDVPVGAIVSVKLSVDQAHIMSLRAEGATMPVRLKSVDADKGTITITITKGRDEDEDKVLNVAKDAHISIDGKTSRLTDLKAGENTVVLRFSLDQQTVESIISRPHDAGRR